MRSASGVARRALRPPDRRPPGAQPTQPDPGRLHGSRPGEPGGGDGPAALTLISDVEPIREAGSRTFGDECSSFVRRDDCRSRTVKPLTCALAPPIGFEPITLRFPHQVAPRLHPTDRTHP